MTPAEFSRLMKSKHRVKLQEEKNRATFDYILADLIGRSVGRAFSNSNKLPNIADAYPSLFQKEEIEEKLREKKAELSAKRFKMFAETFNSQFKEVSQDNERRTENYNQG